MKVTKGHVANWFLMGMQFGYPPCCVGDFILDLVKGTYINRKPRKLNGAGYVPCRSCNRRSEKELIAAINEYRDPTLEPFEAYKPNAVVHKSKRTA